MLNSPLRLPCGAVLKNRLAKAAMTERLSEKDGYANQPIFKLYQKWAETGAGLLITGNVMVDAQHLESAGNVIITDESGLPKLEQWAATTQPGQHLWVQISHSGRQTSRVVNLRPKAPSVVQLKKMSLFGRPQAMSEAEIQAVIQGFVRTASIVQKAGFTGLQIHSAHGYLLSQFLSPLTNKRTDQWGGSLDNRSRLLRTIVRECRQAVGPSFPIGVKLNSADFQRGGFEEADSLEVIQILESEGVDLLEISGGTYERLPFFILNEKKQKESTRKREAYFLDFAEKVKQQSKIPLMITGGVRTYDFCEEVLQNGEVEVIGMARPFITDYADIPAFLRGEKKELDNLVIRTGLKSLEDSAEAGFYARQLYRMAKNKAVKKSYSPLTSTLFLVKTEFLKGMAKRFG
jgi:2,4-dienoyl-CoA reductase-like NADH-dependent reductase (Old Yellow Enzyme family)